MSRNMMTGYPMYPYYGAMRQQNDLLRCTGANGAEQISLPPETTAAVFDDEQDRVYIVSNVGEITGRPKIRYTFDLVKVETPSDTITRNEFDELRRELADVQHAISRQEAQKSGENTGRADITDPE